MMPDHQMSAHPTARRLVQEDPWWVRWPLITGALAIVVVLIVIPLVNVFYQALAAGLSTYFDNLLKDPDTRHAILLTLTVAPAALALNIVFGIAAAWAIARFQFRGRTLLVSLIDLPFSVSPVVAGLIFVLLFGLQGYFGRWLREHGFKIIDKAPRKGSRGTTVFFVHPKTTEAVSFGYLLEVVQEGSHA